MSSDPAIGISTRHLDEVKSLINWALGFVFAAMALTIQGSESFKILDLELSRTAAFVCISLVYSALCLGALIHFERIAQHLKTLTASQAEAEMKSLMLHEWLFNPFVLYRFRCAGYWGFSALIVFFWIGLANLFLFSLAGEKLADVSMFSLEGLLTFGKAAVYALPSGMVAVIGYGVMRVVQGIPHIAADRIHSSAEQVENLKNMADGLHKAADAGIAAGGFVVAAVAVWARYAA